MKNEAGLGGLTDTGLRRLMLLAVIFLALAGTVYFSRSSGSKPEPFFNIACIRGYAGRQSSGVSLFYPGDHRCISRAVLMLPGSAVNVNFEPKDIISLGTGWYYLPIPEEVQVVDGIYRLELAYRENGSSLYSAAWGYRRIFSPERVVFEGGVASWQTGDSEVSYNIEIYDNKGDMVYESAPFLKAGAYARFFLDGLGLVPGREYSLRINSYDAYYPSLRVLKHFKSRNRSVSSEFPFSIDKEIKGRMNWYPVQISTSDLNRGVVRTSYFELDLPYSPVLSAAVVSKGGPAYGLYLNRQLSLYRSREAQDIAAGRYKLRLDLHGAESAIDEEKDIVLPGRIPMPPAGLDYDRNGSSLSWSPVPRAGIYRVLIYREDKLGRLDLCALIYASSPVVSLAGFGFVPGESFCAEVWAVSRLPEEMGLGIGKSSRIYFDYEDK